MRNDDYDFIYKIVICGDSGVGKSNILSKYIKNEFNKNTKTTIGVEFAAKKLEIENASIKAQIWDTAGQERYKAITSCYYKGAKGGIIVYDLTNKDTFDNVDKWIYEFQKGADYEACCILVGNKCDIPEERQVSIEEGKSKAESYSNIIRNIRNAFFGNIGYDEN
jgi:small GTP-binding protein